MQINLSYAELCSILNKYISTPSETESMKYKLLPMNNGLIIKFDRLKWRMINIKKEVQAEIKNFHEGELELKIEINGFLLDILKKILMKVIYKTLKYKLKEDEINLTDYLYITKSRLYIQLNKLLKMIEIPFAVASLETKGNELKAEIHFL